MNEPLSDDSLPSLRALDDKIRTVSKEIKPEIPADITDGSQGRSMAFAFRLVAEFASGIMVGTGLGYYLDKWFSTSPFLLIIGSLLGFAAGIKTMLLTLSKQDKTNT